MEGKERLVDFLRIDRIIEKIYEVNGLISSANTKNVSFFQRLKSSQRKNSLIQLNLLVERLRMNLMIFHIRLEHPTHLRRQV